jgi:hypothetical protein
VDLGLLLVAIWLVRRWVAPLFLLHIFGPYPLAGRWGLLPLLAPPTLALVFASAVQVAFGRADLRRAHRAMSMAFWSVIFVVLAAAGLRLAWARTATPADLTEYSSGSWDPSGRWLYAEGASRRGGGAAFLIDTEEDRYLPIGVNRIWQRHPLGMAFAAGGGSGVLLMRGEEHASVLSVELGDSPPRVSGGELESSPPADYGSRFAVSPSGAYLLLAHENGASVFAVPSGRRLATETIPPGWQPAALRLASESTGRVWLTPSIGSRGSRAEMRLLEMGPGREPRTTRVPLEAGLDTVRSWPWRVQTEPSGRTFLTRDGGLRLRDGGTGKLLATLVEDPAPGTPPEAFGGIPMAVFLSDGRVAVGQALGARTVLRLFDPRGLPLGEMSLDRIPAGLAVGPEVGPGRVAVRFRASVTRPETVIVDLDEGRVVETFTGRHPLPGSWILPGPERPPGTIQFFWEDGTIVRRDFATATERVVAGKGASPGERLAW